MVREARGRQAKDIRRYAVGSFYMQLLNCSGMCLFGAMTSRLPLVEYLNAVTGWQMTADEYLSAGERILSLRKAFNVREGIRATDQSISPRAIGTRPLRSGPLKGVTLDIEALSADFFHTVGWDPTIGGPGPEKIRELGLQSLMEAW
jgi:aldehyde:ferredoxin oxidoreductase